jgi:hypothetical protein
MDPMTSLDDDLVRRWLERAGDSGESVMPQWGIVPTTQERRALAIGGAWVIAAVNGAPASRPPGDTGEADLTELPALLLHRYLRAFAAGVASARLAFAPGRADPVSAGLAGFEDFDDSTDLDDGADFDGGAGDVAGVAGGDLGALALAAGLNAGAAALHGEIATAGERTGQSRTYAEPSAAESARLAGFAAAELVVNGAGLHQVADAAATAACNGWRIGLPGHPVERLEYRTRALLGLLLVALEIQTRDPEPPAEPASCGALPGENLGRPFTAEITFTMGLAPAEIRSLAGDLASLAADVTVWPGSRWPRFHLHTDRAGDVIGQVFAYGTPFDLAITERA